MIQRLEIAKRQLEMVIEDDRKFRTETLEEMFMEFNVVDLDFMIRILDKVRRRR